MDLNCLSEIQEDAQQETRECQARRQEVFNWPHLPCPYAYLPGLATMATAVAGAGPVTCTIQYSTVQTVK